MARLILKSNGKAHGWRPDTPDGNDDEFSMRSMLAKGKVPTLKVSSDVVTALPEEFLAKRRNQGDWGSCTGHGMSGLLMAFCRMNNNPAVLSARFAYLQARKIETSVREDAGAEIRDVVKGAVDLGVATEKTCPYDYESWATMAREPTIAAYTTARWHQANSIGVKGYHRCTSLDEMVQAMANGMALIYGWACFSSLSLADRDGVVRPWQGRGDKQEGGHCTWSWAMNLRDRMFEFENSWGNDWGRDGLGRLPFEYVERGWADDFWAVQHEAFPAKTA